MGAPFIQPFIPSFDASGGIESGALLHFYELGTFIPKPVWTDTSLSVPHPHPLVSLPSGLFPAIYPTPGAPYRVVLTSADGTNAREMPDYTVDPGAAAIAAKADASLFASGTYLPMLTAVRNCSLLSLQRARYSRNGSVVNGSLLCTGTQTAGSSLTKVGFTLPVASALLIAADLIGTCSTTGSVPIGGSVYGDATNGRGEAEWTCAPAAGAGFGVCITFQYGVD